MIVNTIPITIESINKIPSILTSTERQYSKIIDLVERFKKVYPHKRTLSKAELEMIPHIVQKEIYEYINRIGLMPYVKSVGVLLCQNIKGYYLVVKILWESGNE